MRQTLDAPVVVVFGGRPLKIVWNGRDYRVNKVGLHHTYRDGRVLFHVFSLTADGVFFKLVLNSESLNWRLVEVADGLPN
jgi:hypothetical protein